MSKGDHARNPAYSLPPQKYARRPVWCEQGGLHDLDDQGTCTKCGMGETVAPSLPPGVDVDQTVT